VSDSPMSMNPSQAVSGLSLASGATRPPVEPRAGDPVWYGLPQSVWIKIGVITALICAVFWPNLRRLWEKTNPFYGEPEWGHSTCIPLIGLYYLYVHRDALLAAKRQTSWTGLAVALIGLLMFGYGIWPGQNDYVKDVGMVVTIFGVVLLMAGWQVMKIAWFPIAFLICGLPWPGLVYSWVAGPLQQLAANVAVNVLQLTGVRAYAAGTKICVLGHGDVMRTLNVAEACAGLRSLMTFISVAAAVAFLSSRSLWQKLIIVVSAVPIAIFCNVMRVAGQGLLDHYVSQQLSENFAHEFVGLVMLVPAFLLILGVGWVLDQMFVEVATTGDVLAAPVTMRRPDAPATPQAVQAVPPSVSVRAVPPSQRLAPRGPGAPKSPPLRRPDSGAKNPFRRPS
jgi:exosortase